MGTMGRNMALKMSREGQDDPRSEGKWVRISPMVTDITITKLVMATA
jgi:hypothetical protein